MTVQAAPVLLSGNRLYDSLAERMRGQIKSPFRGSITDYARTIWLGSGYIGSWADDNLCRTCRGKGGIQTCRHFEIDTARQLAGPFAAIEDPNVRLVMLLKAAQTAGSLTWDMALHFLIVHSSYMRIKILLDSDEKALKYCDHRLMETLKGNPDIAALMEGMDRFDITKTEIKFRNGKTVIIGGLNDSNASSLPSDVIVVDEGWLHQSDGLMRKAIDRTKQIKHRKVIIVGQAGLADEDQDRLWKSLHKRVPLTWACPCCGMRQQFELTMRRPETFVPAAGKLIVPGSEEWNAIYGGLNMPELALPPKSPTPGSFCGFHISKRFSELNSPEEIKAAAAEAKIECFWCGFHIEDTPQMRRALMATYEQEYRVRGPNGVLYTPENYEVGFWNPDPASIMVPFRDTMHEYILAKKAHQEKSNIVPLRDFYINRWAKAWEGEPEGSTREMLADDYDPNENNPEQKWRVILVDWQESLSYCWYSVHGVAKDGRTWQLARGSASGEADIVKLQKDWNVPDQRVFMDAGHEQEKLVEMCARHRHLSLRTGRYVCWQLFKGSGFTDFARVRKHRGVVIERYRHPISEPKLFYVRIEKVIVVVNLFNFGNLLVSDMAKRYRDGEKCPACRRLNRQPNEPADDNELSWERQLNSEHKQTVRNKKNNLLEERWILKKQHLPNHAWDLLKMLCAFLLKTGIAQSGFKEETVNQPDGNAPVGDRESAGGTEAN